VNGGDPGGFEFTAEGFVVGETFEQLRLHVGGRLFGEGDGGDGAGVEVILFDEAAEALDENGGFAGAGTGDDAGVEVAPIESVGLFGSEIRRHLWFLPRRLRRYADGAGFALVAAGVGVFAPAALGFVVRLGGGVAGQIRGKAGGGAVAGIVGPVEGHGEERVLAGIAGITPQPKGLSSRTAQKNMATGLRWKTSRAARA